MADSQDTSFVENKGWKTWGGLFLKDTMFEAILAIISLTGVLLLLFLFLMGYVMVEEIKRNWDTRRCELPVLVSGALYKPSTYEGSGMDFAQENFDYCTRKNAKDVLRSGMSPFYGILNVISGSVGSFSSPMNSMRAMLAKGRNEFSDFINLQYLKFSSIMIGLTKTYFHIRFSMMRVTGIIVSVLYLMISTFITATNGLLLTFNVVTIVLGVLAGMMFFLMLFLTPIGIIVAILLGTIFAVIAIGTGRIKSSLESNICCDPDAPVKMADGSSKPLKNIVVGDHLFTWGKTVENIVNGILRVESSNTPLIDIYGIKMSNTHRVMYKNKWILAKDHPDGIKVKDSFLPNLICLNTSTHTVPFISKKDILITGDWEEVSTLQGQKAWIDWVNLKLNGKTIDIKNYPTSVPLLSPIVFVFLKDGSKIPIKDVQLNDSIRTKDGYTTVKGIYTGQLHVKNKPKTPEWISDGVWKLEYSFWSTIYGGVKSVKDGVPLDGLCLITEDETFVVEVNNNIMFIRDFTEIGLSAIDESYEMIELFMNKK
jgi:hypothetical protein